MTVFGWIVLCLVLALLYALIVGTERFFGLVYRKAGMVPMLLLAGAILASPVLAWNRYAHRHALSHVPAALGVTTISFEATEAMGFGPGGSEEGLLLYVLPDAAARRIERDGLAVLQEATRASRADGRGLDYWGWQATPASGPGLPIGPEVCVYDACSDVPADVRERVNRTLATPGGYVAHGRPGATIVVSPAERLVIVHYQK